MRRTTVVIDEKLLDRAKALTGIHSTREVVDLALRELVRRYDQRKLLRVMGTVDFRDDWDYKAER